jgi:hypothetical protein
MNWLWAYLRRKTAEALLAGVHDALAAGNGSSGLTDEQATKALRALTGTGESAASGDAGPTPPQLAGPAPSGTGEQADQVRRGPGRPRKFQEPPQ